MMRLRSKAMLALAVASLWSCADESKNGPDAEEGVPQLDALGPAVPSVLPGGVQPCTVFKDERCVSTVFQRCDLHDGTAWRDDPPPLLEASYWNDRYYDKYHRMEGQHAEVYFPERIAPGTPESEWSKPEKFERYEGFGDGSGWTGTALQAAAARYAVTGTGADYRRMLDHLDAMTLQYEANEIPGMLMRSHYAMLEQGAPYPIGHPGKAISEYIEPDSWHYRYPLAQEFLDRLPAYYTAGVDIQAPGEPAPVHHDVTPVWMGDASRDMYVRSLPGVMLAYDLLAQGAREDALRNVIELELPCTLNRMKKGRIRNLQQNPDMIEAITAYFASGDTLKTEPGDLDLTSLDTIVVYIMEQPNPDFMDQFDASCPDGPPMEVDPQYDLDAAAGDFILSFLDLAARIGRDRAIEQPIAWIQLPAVRGSDALFMTQWALTAHSLTGDARYLDFVEGLMHETEYWGVVDLMGSFWLPKWCRSHFAPSLLYPTLWNLQTRIDRQSYPDYWTRLGTAISEETRHKELAGANEVLFGIYYDNMVDAAIDPEGHGHALAMVEMLRDVGQVQNPDHPFDPRRNYAVDWIDNPPPGVTLEPLSDEDRAICETPMEIFGIKLEAVGLEDDLVRATEGLPLPYRVHGAFLWAMDPFMVNRTYGSKEGKVQWPMQGLSVAYWTGRMQGLIPEGQGWALGWRDSGEPCP